MESKQPSWLSDYNQQKHELELRNWFLIDTDSMNITVDDIKSIVINEYIDHEKLKYISLSIYLYI